MAKDTDKIAGGALLAFIGTALGSALNYIYSIYLARNLSPAEFGLYSLGFVTVNLIAFLTQLGIHNGVMRYVALYCGLNSGAKVAETVIASLLIVSGSGIAIAFGLFLVADRVATVVFNNSHLAPVLKLFCLSIPLYVLSSVAVYVLQGLKELKWKVYVKNAAEPAIKFVLTILAFYIGLRVGGIILSYLVSLLISTILALFVIRRKVFATFRWHVGSRAQVFSQSSLLLGFSVPLMIGALFEYSAARIDSLILGHYFTASYVGLYSVAWQTSLMLGMFITAFEAIFAPFISELWAKGDLHRLSVLFKIVSRWIFAFSFPFFLFLAVFPSEILTIFGEGYIGASACLVILCVGELANFTTGAVGYMVMMAGRTWLNFLNSLVMFFFQVILCFALIPKYGMIGAAIATAASMTIVNVIRLVQVVYLYRFHPYTVGHLKSLAAGLMAIGATKAMAALVPLTSLPKIAAIGVFSISLYVCFALLMGLDQDDREFFLSLKHRIAVKVGGT